MSAERIKQLRQDAARIRQNAQYAERRQDARAELALAARLQQEADDLEAALRDAQAEHLA